MNDAAAFRAQVDFFLTKWEWGNLYRVMFGVDIKLNR
jgi:hypothetical protein